MATAAIRAESARNNPVTPFSLGRIYRACRERELSYTRFGREALGDPNLIFDLRRGRELRPATKARLAAFLACLEGR